MKTMNKWLILLTCLVYIPLNLSAQGADPVTGPQSVNPVLSGNTNWTLEKTYLDPSGTYFQSSITYYDALGRPSQSIQARSSADYSKDIVRHINYDRMGRSDTVTYLPFVTSSNNNGRIVSNPSNVQTNYYQTNFSTDPDRNFAYGSKQYDLAGLMTSGSGPGKSSHDYPVQYEYRKNVSGDAVKKYRMYTDNLSLEYVGLYPAGVLTVRKVSRPDLADSLKSESYVYINSDGQTVAKEVRANGEKRFTYYVYDDMGRQRYVIPPIQNTQITTTGRKLLSTLRRYSYYTEYDDYGRVTKQYVPGTEPVYSLYDKCGRLALTQDGNQRESNQWSFTKYDSYDRPVMTGVYTGGTFESHRTALSRHGITSEYTGSTRNVLHGYTNDAYPAITNANDVYQVSYYDNYDWLNGTTYAFSAADALGNTLSSAVEGLMTGTKTKVLDIPGHQWLTSVTYYDDKYQSIQNITDLYPSGKETVSNEHNFLGQVIRTKVKQVVGSNTYEYNKWFNFDAYGRLKNIKQQITGGDLVTLAAYEYDDMGQVATKKIHNAAETTTYKYSISGASTGISSPSFSYDLWFDKVPSGSGLAARHDGNLAHITWGSNTAGNQKGYKMTYDRFGQMKNAIFLEPSGSRWNESRKFAEKNMTYDLNGNRMTLQRTDANGDEWQDMELVYSHPENGNALYFIYSNGDYSEDFEYDSNGNMILDGQTGAQIEYNILNLPKRIFAGNDEVKYIYSASGEKLAQEASGSLTYYRSVMVYAKPSAGSEQLQYMIHPEGIASKTSSGYAYRYFKTDHLGSTRRVLTANGNSLVAEQTTDYYPFGLAHEFQNTQLNKYLFGGKELQDATLGGSMLGLYDFHARFYNPVYGRWFNIDPALQLANPYLYCGNSPMMYADPNGEFFFNAILPGVGTLIDAACWGAAIGGASYTASVAMSPGGFNNWSWSGFGQSVGIGALSGIATSGIGDVFGNISTFTNELGRGLTHGFFQGGMSALNGGNFESGFLAGALSSWTGSIFGITKWGNSVGGMYGFSAAAGGIGSLITGGNFWQGAGIGLMTAGLNHLQNSITRRGLPNWNELSSEDKVKYWLEAQQKAAADGRSYFDIREYVNYPGQGDGAGENVIWMMNIDDVQMPVHLDVAFQRDMRTSTYPWGSSQQQDYQNKKYTVFNKSGGSYTKTGRWDMWTFRRYAPGAHIPYPTVRMIVPTSHGTHFYNFLMK